MHRYASVALIDARGRLLMQERDEHPILDPECWGLPGGGIEPGESAEEAAVRELAEETGVELAADDLEHFTGVDFYSEELGAHGRCEIFIATTDRTEVECHEGRQMVFVDPEQATGLPLTQSVGLVLADLLASTHYRKLLS